MIFRSIDENGDWNFGKGKNSYFTEKMALEANLKTRLKSWKTDCFFAPNEGVDYINFLDVGTKTFLDQDVRRVVFQTAEVLTMESFESTLDRDTREYSAEMTINTIYGTLVLGV